MNTREQGTGLLKGPYKREDHELKIYFEPRPKDGVIICHRRHLDGEAARSITYTVDSSYPDKSLLDPETARSWTAARELMGWKDRRPKMTRHK